MNSRRRPAIGPLPDNRPEEVVAMRHPDRALLAFLALGCAAAHAYDGNGLTVNADDLYWPRWQARLSVTGPSLATRVAPNLGSSAAAMPSGLSVMSDYYLTGSLLGPKRAGGFRATSGLLVGPRLQTWAGPGPAPQRGALSLDRRVFGLSANPPAVDGSADTATLPYLGIGYTRLSPRSGWSFSADVGLVSLSPGNAVKFGRVFNGSQTLDDTLRDMRWSPMLQLGVSYAF
jgi:hypothetical protein